MGLQDENRESFDDALAKANELERKKKEKVNQSPIDLSALESMDAERLRKLIREVSGAAKLVKLSLLTKEEIASAMKLRLANIALDDDTEVKDVIVAVEKWLDRQEGKAKERVEISGVMNHQVDPAMQQLIEDKIRSKLLVEDIPLVVDNAEIEKKK